MCRISPVSCRLCLSENLSAPYTDLSEDVVKAEDIRHVLTLQYSLHDNLHHPRHVCSTCTTTIDAFTTLRDLALKNELVLHENQNNMKPVISAIIKKQVEEENFFDGDFYDDCYTDNDMHPDFSVDEKVVLKSDPNGESKENVEGPVKITFKKPKTDTPKQNWRYRKDGSIRTIKSRALNTEKTIRNSKVRSTVEQLIKDMKGDPNDPNLRYDCPLCDSKKGKNLKKYSLTNHIKWVHKEPDLPCKYEGCKWVFKRPHERRKHHETVHEGVKELCTYCGGYFKNVANHIKAAHEGDKHKCNHCGKEYTSEYGLNYHIKTVHSKFETEVCHICAKEYRDMKAHLKYAHQGGSQIKEVPCEVPECDRMFRNKAEALQHLNAIHLNKREQCPECGISVKNLSTHISQIHTNAKKYPCPQCGKAFGKKCDVRLHVERVHNQRRYVCPNCGKSVSKIREHLRVVHKITDVNIDDIHVERIVA